MVTQQELLQRTLSQQAGRQALQQRGIRGQAIAQAQQAQQKAIQEQQRRIKQQAETNKRQTEQLSKKISELKSKIIQNPQSARLQAQQKSIQEQIKVLEKAKDSLKGGGTFKDLGTVIGTAATAGSQVSQAFLSQTQQVEKAWTPETPTTVITTTPPEQLPGVTRPTQVQAFDTSTGRSVLDPATGKAYYQDASGARVEVTPETTKAVIEGKPIFVTQPPTTSKTFMEAISPTVPTTDFEKALKVEAKQFQQETQKYQKRGFTPAESTILATRGIQEQVTFTKTGAKEIIRQERKKDIIKKIKETPAALRERFPLKRTVTDRKVQVPAFGTAQFDPTTRRQLGFEEVTLPEYREPTPIGRVVQAAALPAKALIMGGEGLLDITVGEKKGGALDPLRFGWAPTKEKDITYYQPEFGTAQFDPTTGKMIPFKEVTETVEVKTLPSLIPGAITTAPYLVPGLAAPLLASDVALATEEFAFAEKGAEKAFDKWYKETYTKTELKPGEKLLSKKEIKAEVLPQFQESIERQALISGGLAVGFLGGAAAFKAGKSTTRFFREPVIKEVPTREVMKPFFIETIETKTIAGRKIPVSGFEIIGETRPPIMRLETTRAREFFKFEPKKVKINQEQTFKQFTPAPVLPGQPFVVAEIRTGRRFAEISRMTGVSAPTDLVTLEGLTKTQKLEWQRLAEEITGRPVALKNVPKILSKESKKVESFMEAEKLFRIKEKPSKIEVTVPWKPGKRITRAEAASLIEPPTDFFGAKIRKVKTVFKDVTMPGARATGKTPVLEGLVIEISPKVDKGVKFMKPTPDKKTPFQKTFQKLDQPKLLPKPVLPEIKTPKPKTILKEAKEPSQVPLMVGGPGLKTIPRAGEGAFERTVGGALPGEDIIISDMKPVEVMGVTKEVKTFEPLVDIITTPKAKVRAKTKALVIPKARALEEVRLIQPTKIKIKERVKEIPALREVVKPKLKVRTEAQARAIGLGMQIRPPRVKPKVKPKVKIDLDFPIVPIKKKKKVIKKAPRKKGGIGIEIKRKGKWERVNLPFSFATKEGADAEAMKRVTREAAASYRLVKSKKPSKRSFRKPTALQKVLFRPGKEKGVKVQKKLLRIVSPGEIKEISLVGAAAVRKKAKKKSPKRKNKTTKKKAKRRLKKK